MNTVERIKAICKERGIAMSRLERECGFSNGYIQALRMGTMPADRLKKVAHFLDVSMDYLLTGEEAIEDTGYYINTETAKIAQELFEREDLRVLMSASRGLTPENAKMVTALVEKLVKGQ